MKIRIRMKRIIDWSIITKNHSTIQQKVESQQKIPPLVDGSTSWFEYEELMEDWLDLFVLEETKRGSVLKNRLVGVLELHKGLLKEEVSLSNRWSQVFQEYVETRFRKRTHDVFHWRFHGFNRARRGSRFRKRTHDVFHWRFHGFNRARRGSWDMVKWIGRFSVSF